MWEKSRGSSSLLSDTKNPNGYEPSGFFAFGGDVGESVRKVVYPPMIFDANATAAARSCSSETCE